MIGWHYQVDGHEFEQAPGIGDGQWSLLCYSLWGHKDSDTNEQLKWPKLNQTTDVVREVVVKGSIIVNSRK